MYRPDRFFHWRDRGRVRILLNHTGRLAHRRVLLILTYRLYR
jgi:hypothetical protein